MYPIKLPITLILLLLSSTPIFAHGDHAHGDHTCGGGFVSQLGGQVIDFFPGGRNITQLVQKTYPYAPDVFMLSYNTLEIINHIKAMLGSGESNCCHHHSHSSGALHVMTQCFHAYELGLHGYNAFSGGEAMFQDIKHSTIRASASLMANTISAFFTLYTMQERGYFRAETFNKQNLVNLLLLPHCTLDFLAHSIAVIQEGHALITTETPSGEL